MYVYMKGETPIELQRNPLLPLFIRDFSVHYSLFFASKTI